MDHPAAGDDHLPDEPRALLGRRRQFFLNRPHQLRATLLTAAAVLVLLVVLNLVLYSIAVSSTNQVLSDSPELAQLIKSQARLQLLLDPSRVGCFPCRGVRRERTGEPSDGWRRGQTRSPHEPHREGPVQHPTRATAGRPPARGPDGFQPDDAGPARPHLARSGDPWNVLPTTTRSVRDSGRCSSDRRRDSRTRLTHASVGRLDGRIDQTRLPESLGA